MPMLHHDMLAHRLTKFLLKLHSLLGITHQANTFIDFNFKYLALITHDRLHTHNVVPYPMFKYINTHTVAPGYPKNTKILNTSYMCHNA